MTIIRALKYHGGLKLSHLHNVDLEALKMGFEILDKHIENIRCYDFNPIIAINKFDTDDTTEIELLRKHCDSKNVANAINESWAKGGLGAIGLAELVLDAVKGDPNNLKPLYDLEWTFEKKMETIATRMYGADHVEDTVLAKQQLRRIDELGLGNLAVCI